MTTAQREHPRYAHEAAVTFLVGNERHEGRTHNLSRGGLCADLSEPIAVGVQLDVEVVLVFDDDARSAALRLPARVVWCTTLEHAYQIGVAFRPLAVEQAEYLALFLKFLRDSHVEHAPDADEDNVDKRFPTG